MCLPILLIVGHLTRPDAKLVKEITADILEKLEKLLPAISDSDRLVGLESRVEQVKSLLAIGLLDVRLVGIWGMGGIGKTTIGVVFNQFSQKFEGKYFMANVREESEKCGVLVHLRNQVLSKVLGENFDIGTQKIPQYIRDRLQRMKVFIVLDDVNNCAFKENHCPEDLLKHSETAVHYAKGNPLALQVLGSSFYGKSKPDWGTDAIKSIFLDLSKIEEINLDPRAFTNMSNVRLLKFYISGHFDVSKMSSKVHLQQESYRTQLSFKKVEQIWEGQKKAPKLKYVDLNHSTNLTRIPEPSETPNLERMNLRNCTGLAHIPSYVQNFNKLGNMIMAGCESLRGLVLSPLLSGLSSLKKLELRDCEIVEIPPDIGCLSSLESLNLSGNNFESFPTSASDSKRLQFLPELTSCLEELDASILQALSNHTDLQQRIRHMIIASRRLFCEKEFDGISFCLPGSEVPDWYSSQSIGSSITIQLPHRCGNKFFIGFSLCVAIEFEFEEDSYSPAIFFGVGFSFDFFIRYQLVIVKGPQKVKCCGVSPVYANPNTFTLEFGDRSEDFDYMDNAQRQIVGGSHEYELESIRREQFNGPQRQTSRYDSSSEQRPRPFAQFLDECGIVLQSLWGKAVKTATYILNRVTTKVTAKTSYELWTDDQINFRQAMESSNSQKWINALNWEMKYMKENDVWGLVPLPEDSMKSTSGYIYLLAMDIVSWKSAKQSLIASSTIAVEFIVCYEASNHGIWLQNFVTRLRIVDGVSRWSSTKSKYIDIKFLVVKERVQSGQLYIEYIGTDSMITDLLTKGLPLKTFHEHIAHMGVVSLKDIHF
ncbi:Disease resistance-like protein DSC1 [Citrus sinensis]|nr:Disease resistance-like protein DSC1 [Citrus sinensis]